MTSRTVAERALPELLAVEPAQFNAEMQAMNDGTNPNVETGGLAKTTLLTTHSAVRTFFWCHDICSPDELITFGQRSEPKHDETDLFTRADVQALTERTVGASDEPVEKPLTPKQCLVCEETLESHWLCCPVCGTGYGPC